MGWAGMSEEGCQHSFFLVGWDCSDDCGCSEQWDRDAV